MPLFESVEFYNPTDTHFTGYWDGEAYEIKPKSSIYVPTFIANHLAKHLINKMLQEQYNALCKKHAISTDDTVKSCEKCRERNQKLIALHTTADREPLLAQMIRKQSEKSEPESTAPATE